MIICTIYLIPEHFHLTGDNTYGFQLEEDGDGGGGVILCVCKAKLLQGCPETEEKVWIC